MTNKDKWDERMRNKIAKQLCENELGMRYGEWHTLTEDEKDEYRGEADSIIPIIRAETIKEVGKRLRELAVVGEFGLCLNMDKWDKFLEALKKGKLG